MVMDEGAYMKYLFSPSKIHLFEAHQIRVAQKIRPQNGSTVSLIGTGFQSTESISDDICDSGMLKLFS